MPFEYKIPQKQSEMHVVKPITGEQAQVPTQQVSSRVSDDVIEEAFNADQPKQSIITVGTSNQQTEDVKGIVLKTLSGTQAELR